MGVLFEMGLGTNGPHCFSGDDFSCIQYWKEAQEV